ncbi:hypothetical protein QFC21_004187 [Naganishia friedmannii]|uniref:Uncharacterized protein n=1 Tax=Naganishia friedmannii TaxID=89922 RepID=A0ACC2VJM1_9TREE|nr:hypothetical protein QFC21_004187 [Naganishia friedmannii]
MSSDAERTASPVPERANDQPAAVSNTEETTSVAADKEAEPAAPSTESVAPVEQREISNHEQARTSTTSTEPALPKLNPGASEFISRSSSAGPGADQKPSSPGQSSRRGPNARTDGNISQSRHAGPRGAPIRQTQHSMSNDQNQPLPDQTANSAENPVHLADPVEAANGVNAAGMTGFRPPRAPREPRPPRGYIPPAPERKARLTADELEEKMAKMRLLNERTQAEQEARNADAQAYETQVSAERERIAKEREQRKAEADAKSKRTLAVQANIDQQREQFRQRKLKLLESQGGAPPPVDDVEEEHEEERTDSYRNFTPNRTQEREGAGGYGGHGGYGYRGGRGGSGGSSGGYGYGNQGEGWQEGRRTHDQGQYNAGGAGRGDFRGRGRGRGAPRGSARQSTGDSQRPPGQNKGSVKAQQTPKIPDAKDESSYPALGDKQKDSADAGAGSQQNVEVKTDAGESVKEASE